MHCKNDAYLHVRAYGRFHKLSADGLCQDNKIDIHNLCHHCRIHNVFYFRCVHPLVLFSISFSSPTFIIYLSLYLILWLSLLCISLPLSLQPRSVSLFRHVNHPRLFISLTLSLSSTTLTHFTLFCFGCNLSVFISPSLSFFPTFTVNFQTCPLSLFLIFSLFSPCSHAHLLYFLSRSLSFSISFPSYLSLQPCSLILLSSVVNATSLPFSHAPFLSLPLSLFSLTHTHFTLVCCRYGLSLSIFSYVNHHFSDTYTTPITLSLSLPHSLRPSLLPSLRPSLPPSLSLISHRMQ